MNKYPRWAGGKYRRKDREKNMETCMAHGQDITGDKSDAYVQDYTDTHKLRVAAARERIAAQIEALQQALMQYEDEPEDIDTHKRRALVRGILQEWGNLTRLQKDNAERIAEIEQELAALYDLHPQQFTGAPGAAMPGDPTGAAAVRNRKRAAGLEAERTRLQLENAAHAAKAARIQGAVSRLPPLECEVIQQRYQRYGMAKKGFWPRIARRVHVSEAYAKELEGKAVDRLAGVIEIEE